MSTDDHPADNNGGRAPAKQMVPDIRSIRLNRIEVSEFCERDSRDDDIQSLAEDIRRHGLLHFPLVIQHQAGSYLLIAGRRRFRAHQLLRKKSMPCRVMQISSREIPLLSLAENAWTRPLKPLERARLLKLMKDHLGMTEEQLSEETGLPQSVVSEHLSILALPDDVIDSVGPDKSSAFTATHAVLLARIMRIRASFGQDEARQLRDKVIQGGISTTELKQMAEFIKQGHHDQLPQQLQLLFLRDRYMTRALAELFLDPARALGGDGALVEEYRAAAQGLTAEERMSAICQTVAARQGFDHARRRILERVKKKVGRPKQPPASESWIDELLAGISAAADVTRRSRTVTVDLDRCTPAQLQAIELSLHHLREQITWLESVVSDAISPIQNCEKDVAETGKENQDVAVS